MGSMNSPNGAYDGLCTTIGGCFDVLASHVSPAASKTIYTPIILFYIENMFHTKSPICYFNITVLHYRCKMQIGPFEEKMDRIIYTNHCLGHICMFNERTRVFTRKVASSDKEINGRSLQNMMQVSFTSYTAPLT